MWLASRILHNNSIALEIRSNYEGMTTLLGSVCSNVAAVIEEWGGVRTIFLRFFEGHQARSLTPPALV